MQRTYERNPKRFWLEEKDCERMTRSELTAVKWLLAMLSTAKEGQVALRERLKSIPSGNQRMSMVMGGFEALTTDLIGTITRSQAKLLQGTMKDYDVRLMPKITPSKDAVILGRSEAKDLLDCAREKCKACTEDGNSCRDCKLYQFLEATTPLDDYGTDLMCPYSLAEWED